ncbi:hypothetical protein G7Y79_00029g063530 [Physcia stellaris]|nr:hypothetical protein G7Y79_00029g063530 [Physcia stellaris]
MHSHAISTSRRTCKRSSPAPPSCFDRGVMTTISAITIHELPVIVQITSILLPHKLPISLRIPGLLLPSPPLKRQRQTAKLAQPRITAIILNRNAHISILQSPDPALALIRRQARYPPLPPFKWGTDGRFQSQDFLQ